jgi:hypothetical protein
MTDKAPWILGMLVVALILGLAAAGYQRYGDERQVIRDLRRNELKTIAALKAEEITRWRMERLRRAQLDSSGMFRTLTLSWMGRPDDVGVRAALLARLSLVRETYGYRNVIIARPDGTLMLSADPGITTVHPRALWLVERAAAQREAVLGELFRRTTSNELSLNVAAPILDEQNRPVAVVLIRMDPEALLFPLIRSWPNASPSAETMMVLRDGAEALVLSPVRHRDDPPMTIRFPLTDTNVVAVQAALGRFGGFEGIDYRGVEVLAEIRPVADSNWVLVAKLDRDEICVELRDRGWMTLVVVVLVLQLLAAVGQMVNGARKLARKLPPPAP